jgi:hypothetical protein
LTDHSELLGVSAYNLLCSALRQRRGPFFASIKRINANKEFFERVWRAQPRCMALFGPKVEEMFLKLHQARRHIEVGGQMLAQRANESHNEDTDDTRRLYEQLRRDIWDHGNFEPEKNRGLETAYGVRCRGHRLCGARHEGEYRVLKLRWWK